MPEVLLLEEQPAKANVAINAAESAVRRVFSFIGDLSVD
jgi:hypothetical protein